MGPPLEFCKIFVVYGKDSGLSERDFREHFEKYGDISSINISKQQDGRPKGYTYIGYERTSEACLAMEQMDGQIIGNLRRPLKIHIAHDKRDNLEIDVDQDHMLERLCIKHAKDVDERSIKEYFDQFGRILRVHCLTDKNTRENIGLAFVKYELQSSAARALEECDEVYKPRWADVRRKSALEHDSGMGGGRGGRGGARFDGGFRGGRGGGGGRGYGGDQGMNDDYFGNRQEQPGSGYGMGGGGNFGMMGQGMGDMDMGFDAGPRRIEAMVPPSLTKQQVFRIFDIAQGLETFTIDANTGMATVEYLDHKSALHAKEKIDGLDVFGQAIAVRLAKPKSGFEETAQQLQQTLATLQTTGGNRNNLDHLVQSIQQVSNALQSQGMQGGGRNMEEMVPWCDVPLPPKQPLLPKNTMQRGKLFIVTVPEAVPNEMLQNAFCRFGDLIICGYQPGKRFGFANFANKEAARRAMNTMHGAVLGGNKMKVEFSRQDKDDTSEMDDSPRKRPRQF